MSVYFICGMNHIPQYTNNTILIKPYEVSHQVGHRNKGDGEGGNHFDFEGRRR